MNNIFELERQLNNLKEDETHISYFIDLAINNIRKDPEMVKQVLDKVLDIAKEKKYSYAYSCCLLYIGWYHYYRSEIGLATKHHLLAYNLLLDLDDKKTLARVCNALMSDYVIMGAFDFGIEYGLQAIDITNNCDDPDMRIRLLINTASAYSWGQYYQKAVDLVINLHTSQYEVKIVDKILIFNVLGEAYYNLGNYKDGYINSIRALDIIKENDLDYYEPEVLMALAPIQFKLGNCEEAYENFEKSIVICKKYNNINIKVNILLRWAICDLSINRYNEAKIKLEIAISDALVIDSKLMLCKLYEYLGKTCNYLKEYKEAYEYLEKAKGYERLIYTQNNSLWFAKLDAYKIEEEAKLYKELYDKMNTISKIGKRLTTKLNITDILSSIYDEVGNIIKADCLSVALYNKKNKCLDYTLFVEGGEPMEGLSISIDDEKSIGAFAVRNKVDILINDFDNDYKKYVPDYIMLNKKEDRIPQSLLYCPLLQNDKILGVITLQNYSKNAYNIQDLSTLNLLVSYIVIAIDNANLFKEVEFLAAHDHLTGNLNRREIIRIGNCNVKEKLSNEKLTVLIIDVDYFKQINDKFGHSTGDQVLIKISKIINDAVRKKDSVGRYGGEEFLVVLPNADAIRAKAVGERIRSKIEKHQFEINGKVKTNITISIGLYEFKEGELSFYDGVKKADKALYKAKEYGRNRLIEY